MERCNKKYHIIKWDFDPTSWEVDRKWYHEPDSATSTRNRKIVCERRKFMEKIHSLKNAFRNTRCDKTYITQEQAEHPNEWKFIYSI